MNPLTILDHGVGNIGSVVRAFNRIGAPVELTSKPNDVVQATQLVLPGVGHFGEAMSNLRARGLEEPLREAVARGVPLLGICVGFQMLFEGSEEAPGVDGLGLLSGQVRRFASVRPVPHIGWNQLELVNDSFLLEGVESGDYFYFLHSYYARPDTEGVAQAQTDYDVSFCSVGGRGKVVGIQFHPEKSQRLGLRVLRNFWRSAEA